MPYSPLGRGFLTGTVDAETDLRRRATRRLRHPRFTKENRVGNQTIAANVERIAAEKGVTPAQIAIAWVLAQGDDIVPIPGTKRRKYLDENVAALDVAAARTPTSPPFPRRSGRE